MFRLAPLLPLALTACAMRPDAPPSPTAASRPATKGQTATPDLRGRWTVTLVNGRPEPGLWLELGGEGLATITTRSSGVYVASPQPPTKAFLGCNWWRSSGWTRSGDKLTLGREMSTRTERGCDAASEALDDLAYSILSRPMIMELGAPDRLRLANEIGTLELVSSGTEAK
jgi:hypothetical protein